MQYEIKTIKDIFDKIPPDKVDVCLKELSLSIQQAQMLRDILSVVETETTGLPPQIQTLYPDIVIWHDDGEGSITTNISFNGEPLMSVKSTMPGGNP